MMMLLYSSMDDEWINVDVACVVVLDYSYLLFYSVFLFSRSLPCRLPCPPMLNPFLPRRSLDGPLIISEVFNQFK